MPIYEYRCNGCGLTQQERRRLEERDKTADCKVCGGDFTRALGVPHTWGPTRGLK